MDDQILQQPSLNVPSFQPEKKPHAKLIITVLVIAILIVGGSVAAKIFKWNPVSYFSHPLTSEQVIGKMLDSITDIKSAKYNLQFSFISEQRDADAQPIDTAFPEYEQQKEAIKRDSKRLSSLSSIVSELNYKKQKDKKYPVTLTSLIGAEKYSSIKQEDLQDPQTNQQYGYRQDRGGAGFTLAVQLETDAAARAYKQSLDSSLKYDGKEKSAESPQKLIEVHEDTPRVYASVNFSDISPFPLGLDFDGMYQYLPAEINAQLSLVGQSESDPSKANDGSYTVSGSLDLSGITFKAGLDILKKAQTFYVRVNDAPSLGFFDLAAVKGKWIRAVPEDAYGTFLGGMFYSSNGQSVDAKSAQLLKQYQLFFSIIKEENLIRVSNEFPQDTKDNKKLYHYQILLDRTKLPEFYRRLTEQSKKDFGDDSIFTYNEQTLTYLQSNDFVTVFDFLEKNVQLELWVDGSTFFPTKISYSFRLVPPDSVLKLKGKQHRSTLVVGLDTINTPLSIEAPVESIPVDEARMLLTGETIEQIKFDRQVAQVDAIRTALSNYYDYTGSDPKSLDELLKKINDVPSRQGLDLNGKDSISFSRYTLKDLKDKNKPFLTILPKDIYTGVDYVYSSDGKSYTLQYQIKLPPKKEDTINDYEFESRSKQYVEGINTATAKFKSAESGSSQSVPTISSETAQQKAADARIKSSIAQLRTLAEVYYDSNASSYAGFDSCLKNATVESCKISSTKSSVESLQADLGGGTNVHANKTQYCISHALESGLFFCVDSTGQAVSTEKVGCESTTLACAK